MKGEGYVARVLTSRGTGLLISLIGSVREGFLKELGFLTPLSVPFPGAFHELLNLFRQGEMLGSMFR